MSGKSVIARGRKAAAKVVGEAAEGLGEVKTALVRRGKSVKQQATRQAEAVKQAADKEIKALKQAAGKRTAALEKKASQVKRQVKVIEGVAADSAKKIRRAIAKM